MPVSAMAIAGAAGLGGSLIGEMASADEREAAKQATESQVKQWLSIHVPDPREQAIELQRYRSVGKLSPKMEQAFEQSQSELKNLQIDPTGRAAELKALAQMQNISDEGGMDAQARQAEAQAISAANANEQGQRGAILQSYAQRGMGGAGAELAAQLQAQQSSANRAAEGGLTSAANAQQRALQAMSNAATQGSALRTQDYNQAAAAASAQDAINRFNTQTKQGVEHSNVGTANSAQGANLANDQSIANANTGVANTEETHNQGLLQDQFNNQTKIAAGAGGALGNVAEQQSKEGERESKLWGNIGSAVGAGASAYGQYANTGSETTRSG